MALPLFAKVDVNEVLFDSLGSSDRAWSRTLGGTSMRLLFAALQVELCAARSCIVEANFSAEYDTPTFLALRDRYPFQAFQIQCVADGEILFERFKTRARTGERHPGHVEHDQDEEQRMTLLHGRTEPLALAGTLCELDTGDFSTLDTAPLLAALRAALAAGEALA